MATDALPRDSVGKCVRLLKNAQTDNEKFAALLFIGQMEKTLKFRPDERKLIYQSVDFFFIKKLLNSKKEPEGCKKGVLMSIGLTIFSCMINEPDNSEQKQEFFTIAPRLLDIMIDVSQEVTTEDPEDEQFKEDVLQNCFSILIFMTSYETGCEYVICHGLNLIRNAKFIFKKEIEFKLAGLILQCIRNLSKDRITPFVQNIQEIMGIIAKQLAFIHDARKFSVLQLYFDMLSSMKEKNLVEVSNLNPDELKHLRIGMMDILQSKVDVKYRHLALKLSSQLIEVHGLPWTYTSYQNEDKKYSQKFLHFLISLTSVEIKMLFYDKKDDFELLSYLFSIIENIIEAMSCEEDHSKDDSFIKQLSADTTSKILQAINSVVSVLLYCLGDVSRTSDVENACTDIKVISCIRLLCVFMSEETHSLKKDVILLAPFLLDLGKASFNNNKKDMLNTLQRNTSNESSQSFQMMPSIFSFLLPVLCHWSAEDETRRIILGKELQICLWEYLTALISCQQDQPAVFQTMETLFGIFMNIAITEPELASDNKSIFGKMLQLIMKTLVEFSSKPTNILMNMLTLGLILARRQNVMNNGGSAIDFFRHCLDLLILSCPFIKDGEMSKDADWAGISELWLIAFDNSTSVAAEAKELRVALGRDPLFLRMAQFVEENKKSKSHNIQTVCSAFVNLIKIVTNDM